MSTVSSRPDWLTLKNGSKTYIDAVMKEFSSGKVSLNTPVHKVSNDNNGRVTLHMANDETETFDHVVLATHGDQALSILGDSATNVERAVLSSFKTSQNEAVLHSDLTHMPRNREAWSSWNYMTLSSSSRSYTDQVSLTYNMNILQHIPRKQFGDVLVTLNPLHPPNPTLTQGRFQYSHPLYTSEAIRAQSLLHTIQNKRGISYAGAWTKYGFHEDGFTSGLQVAQDHLGAKLPFELVDSKTSRGKPELGLADHLLRFVMLFIQVFVIQTLEVFAGTSRRQAAKPVKEVKQK
jgi:predicted NAD/FAD-binding protein